MRRKRIHFFFTGDPHAGCSALLGNFAHGQSSVEGQVNLQNGFLRSRVESRSCKLDWHRTQGRAEVSRVLEYVSASFQIPCSASVQSALLF